LKSRLQGRSALRTGQALRLSENRAAIAQPNAPSIRKYLRFCIDRLHILTYNILCNYWN